MRIFMLLGLVVMLLAGCATGPAEPDPDRLAAEQAARSAFEAGDYRTAAESYQELAEDSAGRQADEYQLTAIEAYIRADELDRARELLEPLDFEAEEEPRLFARERLLEAELALASGEPALALERLDGVAPLLDETGLRADYHLLRARAFEQQGNPIGEVAERLAADAALQDESARLEHAEILWSKLRQLERTDLSQLGSGADESTSGWVELALIAKAGLTNDAILQRTLDDWQLSYPGHPAASVALPRLRERGERLDRTLEQVALLLPLNSEYADAAAIIRDGFLAAWYAGPEERPQIRIYDSSGTNVVKVYERAIADGADMVVGPLEKDTLARLIEQGEISKPTLALNFYEGEQARINTINADLVPQLYQFSLSPEEEARQVAERAWSDGHEFALALTPANDWGDRLFTAFGRQFVKLGGDVERHVAYSSADAQDYAAAVKSLLRTDSGRVQRLLAEKEPGLGGGFIMLAGAAADGRQIGPQLRYFRAGHVPVYATSHIYGGTPDKGADADMNGFMFVDMPWVLDASYRDEALYRDIRRHWGERMEDNPRLFAFGIDAYRLLSQLDRLAVDQSLRFNGATGRLSVGEDGRIHRQLVWARFVDGVPQLIDARQLVRH